MRGEIISIGTELTTGAVVDTNSAWLADRLGRLGVLVTRHCTVGDDQAELTAALAEACRRADWVIVTGGLGPTLDDVTREALADLVGQRLVEHAPSMRRIEEFFASIGRPMSESNRRQALRPEGAEVLDNAWGTAPGIHLRVGPSAVFALPGVPREMQAMFTHYAEPVIRERGGGAALARRVLRTYGAGESVVAEQIADLMAPGRNPAVGTTASEGVISIRVVAEGPSPTAAEALAEADCAAVRARLGELVYGEEDATLAAVVGRLLADRGQTVATAESCTGGLIGQLLTEVPGGSTYYLGGLVCYSNALKIDLLGVPAELIAAQGAVSEPVAARMAEGCRVRAGSDYALSATGIAGPGGGTPDKPVGMVFLGLADARGVQVTRCQFSDRLSRQAIRDRSAKTALNLLRRTLLAGGSGSASR